MDDKEIKNQNNDVRMFIFSMKKKVSLIKINKIRKVKKYSKGIKTEIEVPFDIITYSSIMKTKISVRQRELEIPHKEVKVNKEPISISINDIISWFEIMYNKVKKSLTPSFFIDYKKYKKYRKKDTDKIILNNFEDIYSLQKELIETEVNYMISLYKMLPKILKIIREEKNIKL